MEAIRNLILDEDKDFKKAYIAADKQTVFTLEGDMYKRNKYPDKPDNLKNWLNRKNVCFIANNTDFELLLSDKLVRDFKLLELVYNFLIKAEISKSKGVS